MSLSTCAFVLLVVLASHVAECGTRRIFDIDFERAPKAGDVFEIKGRMNADPESLSFRWSKDGKDEFLSLLFLKSDDDGTKFFIGWNTNTSTEVDYFERYKLSNSMGSNKDFALTIRVVNETMAHITGWLQIDHYQWVPNATVSFFETTKFYAMGDYDDFSITSSTNPNLYVHPLKQTPGVGDVITIEGTIKNDASRWECFLEHDMYHDGFLHMKQNMGEKIVYLSQKEHKLHEENSTFGYQRGETFKITVSVTSPETVRINYKKGVDRDYTAQENLHVDQIKQIRCLGHLANVSFQHKMSATKQ